MRLRLGGALALPDMTDTNGQARHLAIGTRKDSNIYSVDRDNICKFNPQNDAMQFIRSWTTRCLAESGQCRLITAARCILARWAAPYGASVQQDRALIDSGFDHAARILADNLAQEPYNSNQAANGRDSFGAGNKLMVPTIANGKVYAGTPKGGGGVRVSLFAEVSNTAASFHAVRAWDAAVLDRPYEYARRYRGQ